ITCYDATQTITVAGGGTTFTVNDGGQATMIAGQNILYLPGTTVVSGGYMLGKIAPNGPYCGQQAPSIVTVVTGEEDPEAMLLKASFKLCPNPTTGKFTLEQIGGSPGSNVVIAIYGMHGEKVMTKELTGQKKYELSIAGFPAGLYFVKVVAGEYNGTIKLIKTN
ncbi:MAG: T9SS type A sorting domain-containing protein, partial [Bacteroidota bacterium]